MRALTTLVVVVALLGAGCAQKGAIIRGMQQDSTAGPTWMIYDDGGGSGDALYWCVPPETPGQMPKCVKAQMVDIGKLKPIVISPAAKKGKK
jgi:hypothetical protein